jgi:hypothetical protein
MHEFQTTRKLSQARLRIYNRDDAPGSMTERTALTVMAASIAVPPRRKVSSPADTASGWLAATAPFRQRTFARWVFMMEKSIPVLLGPVDSRHE